MTMRPAATVTNLRSRRAARIYNLLIMSDLITAVYTDKNPILWPEDLVLSETVTRCLTSLVDMHNCKTMRFVNEVGSRNVFTAVF